MEKKEVIIMNRIGKDYQGKVMYMTEIELRQLKESGNKAPGTNQQKAKIRKIVNRLDKPKY